MNPDRKVIIIAGPNGAGKTTFAREFLPNEAVCPVFVNADLIAAGLAPFAPETAAAQAGRLMLPNCSGISGLAIVLPSKPHCRAAATCAISGSGSRRVIGWS